jgi:isoleucyl-tRNA synthetase
MVRLIAPVLCFTAEEVWQELETQAGRQAWDRASVHTEQFPEPLEVAEDAALLQRWDRLMRLREEVNKALEQARSDGQIGGSLQARLIVDTSDRDTLDFLKSFGDDLRFLFITSEVAFGAAGDGAFRSTDVPGLVVGVEPSPGRKCERCWNYTEDVGQDVDWPSVCARCAQAVREVLSETGSA